ncbi:MAG: hypothetical protein HY063_14615 [Bacteroidetes bacterium]|nr:hypothetical protein [Bacteroidota bacterium]
MKKIFLSALFVVMTAALFAQDAFPPQPQLVTRKGEPFLPDSGDWAISFDAVPFMNYMGNLFSGSTTQNTSPGAAWLNPTLMTVTGKMFKDAHTALRADVRIGFNSASQSAMIQDASVTNPSTYPAVPPMREDVMTNSGYYIGIGIGKEKRRGKTRLQGYYGYEFILWRSGRKNKFEYGNVLAATGTPVSVSTTTTTDFGTTATSTGSNITTDTYGNAARITNERLGTVFGIGARGFVGAEYFLFSKISIGAEYGWGVGVASIGKSTRSMESVGGSPPSVGTQTITGGKASSFGFDTDINGGLGSGTGSLKITLHF